MFVLELGDDQHVLLSQLANHSYWVGAGEANPCRQAASTFIGEMGPRITALHKTWGKYLKHFDLS
jgi:hypothetical protein